jgi:hypothetical protein
MKIKWIYGVAPKWDIKRKYSAKQLFLNEYLIHVIQSNYNLF